MSTPCPLARTLVLCLLTLASACSGPGARAPHPAAAAPRMDPELLTLVQRRTFDFFWEGAHPSGLAYDALTDAGPVERHLAIGATGMGLMAIVVGVERQFVTRREAAQRVAGILDYLQHRAVRYHGAWPHWIDAETGDGIGPEGNDSYHKGDIVETAYLAAGMLAAARYFDDPRDTTEQQVRTVADELWRSIEWDFYWIPKTGAFRWHWSSDLGFEGLGEDQVYGFNECMIVFMLAMASPTHAVPPSAYATGWAQAGYVTTASYNGIRQWVQYTVEGGWGRNISLFWTHYSYLGLDPRVLRDPPLGGAAPAGYTYYDVFRDITLINRAYCLDQHPTYAPGLWGLTASDDPAGYAAHSPVPYNNGMGDNGTITPSAALSAMPYTPDPSYEALVAFRADPRLWGRYGFYDAFNPERGWYSRRYIGIDQGPIVIMIENHRTRLLWRLFMSHPDIARLLTTLAGAGWTIVTRAD